MVATQKSYTSIIKFFSIIPGGVFVGLSIIISGSVFVGVSVIPGGVYICWDFRNTLRCICWGFCNTHVPGGVLVGISVIPGVGVVSKCVVKESVGMKNMVAGGDTSGGDPSMKKATHSTTVPLYCGSAGMVRMSTMVPFSLTEPDLMLRNCPLDKPFTLQVM